MLTSPASFIFAVGDDDQSIYGFRGARPGNMKDLQKDFKIKNVIKLEQNYRSKNNILNAANSIIENNSDRLGKNLWVKNNLNPKPKTIFAYSADKQRYSNENSILIDDKKSNINEWAAKGGISIRCKNGDVNHVIEKLKELGYE